MKGIREIHIVDALAGAAMEIEFQLRSVHAAGVLQEAYAPAQEAERADAVDRVCAELARELALRLTARSVRPLQVDLGAELLELVLWRLRDAQRQLRQGRPMRWTPGQNVTLFLDRLLVEAWHSYAERYWLERVERFVASRETHSAELALAH